MRNAEAGNRRQKSECGMRNAEAGNRRQKSECGSIGHRVEGREKDLNMH